MTTFALNHMTVARLSYVQLLDIAAQLGCIGVEVRNDLPQPLFDGMDPAEAGDLARSKGLRILAVAYQAQLHTLTQMQKKQAEFIHTSAPKEKILVEQLASFP